MFPIRRLPSGSASLAHRRSASAGATSIRTPTSKATTPCPAASSAPRRASPHSRKNAGCARRSCARRGGAELTVLEHLFEAELVYRSGMEPITQHGEGELIGSGDGTV